MRSSLAWCLEPEWAHVERPKLGSHRTGMYVRKTNVKENFERLLVEAPRLKREGLTGKQIAFRLGASRDATYKALRMAGLGAK